MTDFADRTTRRRLIVPPLGRVYASLGELAETVLRVVAGLALVTHGVGKIANPFEAAGMVEGLGFYPRRQQTLGRRQAGQGILSRHAAGFRMAFRHPAPCPGDALPFAQNGL
jgi:hypothetical protein